MSALRLRAHVRGCPERINDAIGDLPTKEAGRFDRMHAPGVMRRVRHVVTAALHEARRVFNAGFEARRDW